MATRDGRWAPEEEWDYHRATLTHLFVNEGKTVKQVMGIMQRRHHFHATAKMYQDHIDHWLGPKEQTTGASQSEAPTANQDPGSQPSTANKKWAAPEDWDMHRSTISRLYDQEGKTLAQVTDIMEREHGFRATTKMYKTRFKRWGLWKNTKAADVTDMILKPEENHASVVADSSMVLVNGRYLDKKRVDAYIKRRRRQVLARLGQHPDVMSSIVVSPSFITRAVDSPMAAQADEKMYLAIQKYYDNRLATGKWAWKSAAQTGDSGRGATETVKRQANFFERFRLAVPLLDDPAGRGAEGVKMMRICFAELEDLLRAEDSMLLFCILAILYHIRRASERLQFLQGQLVRQLVNLATAMNHPSTDIWKAILESIVSQTLNNHRSLQCCNVVTNRLDQALGLWHVKTTEWAVISMTFSDDGPDAKEARFRRMLVNLDALGTFDERHAGMRMNFAAFYFRYEKYEQSAEVILEVHNNPVMARAVQGMPIVNYKLWWRLGQIRCIQRDWPEAEKCYAQALKVARSQHNKGGQSLLLDCLVAIEKCLRDQGRMAEADSVLAERESIVRETLEKVGEQEDSVAPAAPGAAAAPVPAT